MARCVQLADVSAPTSPGPIRESQVQGEIRAAIRFGPYGWIGIMLAMLAGMTVVVLPAGWLTIGMAAAATLALGREPRLGWIPAGLLVTLAVPFGRAADLDPLTVGGIPLRPHDAIIAIAVVGVMLALARSRRPPALSLTPGRLSLVAAAAAFAAVGLVAIAWGALEGQTVRDILRDARWWFLYLMAPVALLAGIGRDALLRALVIGGGLFAMEMFATLALPAFPGGLKEAALVADSGAIRMQFGNSIFLVPTVAVVTHIVIRRPIGATIAALALTFGALVLSLTRISILVTAALVVVLVAASFLPHRRRSDRVGLPSLVRRPLPALGALLTVVVSGIASVALITAVTLAASGEGGTSPLGRLLFEEEGSDMDAILGSASSGGRLATYVNAYRIIEADPVLGGGMGQQVEVQFATRPGRVFTPGQQPGVDNAYLTVGMKAGVLGIAAFTAILLLPLRRAIGRFRGRPRLPRPAAWYLGAWLAILGLTLTQSFAVSGYSPFGIALLATIPFLRSRGRREEHRQPPATPSMP